MSAGLTRFAGAMDDRVGGAGYAKTVIRKVFPDHWSFFLGELALYSFIVLLLTGTWLALFFKPDMSEIAYHGSYVKLSGVSMSQAYASTLHISFDIRGGLLIRQIHHWAALLFVGAISIHVLRIFFTGAFRKPRELNWVIGTTMFALAAFEGFAGYSLPDDLLSGTGLRIADGITMSIPVVGSYLSFFALGGQYPGQDLIPRLYILHVLLVPGLLIALITAHLMIVWRQGHAQWPGKKQTDSNEVGDPLLPAFLLKTSSLFFMVFAALAALATVAQINPVWLAGPYDPVNSSNEAQPDWYIGFLEGALRLMPGVETNVAGHTIVWNVLIPGALLPALFFLIMGGYPVFERWVTGDSRPHQVLDRPRNMPARTALGAAIVAMAAVLEVAGGDDFIAYRLGFQIEAFVWVLRVAFFTLPAVTYLITWRVCTGLQRADRRRLRDGEVTGVVPVPGQRAYAPVTRRPDEDSIAALRTRRPDELLVPLPRHVIPLPIPRRVTAQVRARINQLYTVSRLETTSQDKDDDDGG